MSQWLWSYEGFDPDEEGLREALCTLGNGYLATRGALAEASDDGVHYPGSYLAGVYNRLSSEIAGRVVENESLVNVPNWLVLRFRLPGGPWFDTRQCEVLDHHQQLDLHRGVLTRRTRYREPGGKVLDLTQRRFVSLRDHHLACMETSVVAENWSGPLLVHSALDGTVTNNGVERYRDLPGDHLRGVESSEATPDTICLEVETNRSHVRIAQSARTRFYCDGVLIPRDRTFVGDTRYAGHDVVLDLTEGTEVIIEKMVATFTSRDDGIYEPLIESMEWAATIAGDFDELLERHVLSWSHGWNRSRISLGSDSDTALVLNLHSFHLLQTISKNSVELDVGVPARGLHGEAYRGHIFWDELFIFPYLNLRVPELTRALLRYRARRLDQARRAATAAGYEGAMYPWQSGSNGREETQTMHLNPRSGRWLPDASHRQRHISAAIAYNVWQYWEVTEDLEFMRFWGAEMLLEIARFWASIATYNHLLDRYEIRGVMGPDEYHEGYPWADHPGLDNNAYTNLMAVWVLCRAFDVLEILPPRRRHEMKAKLRIDDQELDLWGDISRKMRLCFHDGDDGRPVISQFEHYEKLEELDWNDYIERYGDIARLDRILEAEGDSTDRYRLAKQADTVMLFYLLSAEVLAELLERLGYEYDESLIPRHIEYYEKRTSHGSTLSRVVHAWLHARLDRTRSWEQFCLALGSDVADVQGGTTREGIHLGAMAGTVDLVQRCYTGIETRQDMLRLNPVIPPELGSLKFEIRYRGHMVDLAFTTDHVHARVALEAGTPINIAVRDQVFQVEPGASIDVDL